MSVSVSVSVCVSVCVCGVGWVGVCMCGGGGAAEASCNKLHGTSCNTNKFINFVESVRPKKAIPYTMISIYVECHIDVVQRTDTAKRFLICT